MPKAQRDKELERVAPSEPWERMALGIEDALRDGRVAEGNRDATEEFLEEEDARCGANDIVPRDEVFSYLAPFVLSGEGVEQAVATAIANVVCHWLGA